MYKQASETSFDSKILPRETTQDESISTVSFELCEINSVSLKKNVKNLEFFLLGNELVKLQKHELQKLQLLL